MTFALGYYALLAIALHLFNRPLTSCIPLPLQPDMPVILPREGLSNVPRAANVTYMAVALFTAATTTSLGGMCMLGSYTLGIYSTKAGQFYERRWSSASSVSDI